MNRSRFWFVSQTVTRESPNLRNLSLENVEVHMFLVKNKIAFFYLKENVSRKSKCCWASALKTQARVKVGQAQRTTWAIKEQGGGEAKHWSQAPSSQSRTTSPPSWFTRCLPLFNLGQSFWAVCRKPWGREDRSTLCFWHPPVTPCAQSTKGCQHKPRCNRRPFWHLDILGWSHCTTP